MQRNNNQLGKTDTFPLQQHVTKQQSVWKKQVYSSYSNMQRNNNQLGKTGIFPSQQHVTIQQPAWKKQAYSPYNKTHVIHLKKDEARLVHTGVLVV